MACRRLGVSEEASFEEVQEARNFLYEVTRLAITSYAWDALHGGVFSGQWVKLSMLAGIQAARGQ